MDKFLNFILNHIKIRFQCNFCNRGYNTAAALTSHMQNHKKQNELRERNESPYNFRYAFLLLSLLKFYKNKKNDTSYKQTFDFKFIGFEPSIFLNNFSIPFHFFKNV